MRHARETGIPLACLAPLVTRVDMRPPEGKIHFWCFMAGESPLSSQSRLHHTCSGARCTFTMSSRRRACPISAGVASNDCTDSSGRHHVFIPIGQLGNPGREHLCRSRRSAWSALHTSSLLASSPRQLQHTVDDDAVGNMLASPMAQYTSNKEMVLGGKKSHGVDVVGSP